jgi:hypothetical protein
MTDASRDRIAADVRAVVADPVVAERLTATGQIVTRHAGGIRRCHRRAGAAHLATFAKALGIKPKQ